MIGLARKLRNLEFILKVVEIYERGSTVARSTDISQKGALYEARDQTAEVEGVRVLDGALGNREPLHPVRQGRMVAQHDCLGVARPRKDLPPVERPFILSRMSMVL